LQSILANPSSGLGALILVPTRELAMQVASHLRAVACHARIRVISVVGGLSHLKQRRQLADSPDIIVATPGRLWDLVEEDATIRDLVKTARFLVLDEADRMLQTGSFKDLEMILECLSKKNNEEAEDKTKEDRRTLLFSATLIPDASTMLQDNGKKKRKVEKKGKKSKGKAGTLISEEDGENVIRTISMQTYL
jgi:ATP-dependent RNA helicase DDX24/MAK5